MFGWREDAAPSLFLQTELQAIEATIYETPFAPLKADSLIPVKSIPRGTQEAGYDRTTGYGVAAWIAGLGTDAPSVNAARVRTLYSVRSHGAKYHYSRADLEAAAMAGLPLDATLGVEARRACETFRNGVALSGDASVGLTGFLNDPNVPLGTAPNGGWASTASPDDILRDLNEIRIAVWTQTKEAYIPDTIAIPATLFGHISLTPRSANSDTTILEFFLKSQDQIKSVVPMLELETAGAGGTGRMICYLKALSVLEQAVAIPFEQLPPQFIAFGVEVNCWSRTGGMHWKAPIAAAYRDGL